MLTVTRTWSGWPKTPDRLFDFLARWRTPEALTCARASRQNRGTKMPGRAESVGQVQMILIGCRRRDGRRDGQMPPAQTAAGRVDRLPGMDRRESPATSKVRSWLKFGDELLNLDARVNYFGIFGAFGLGVSKHQQCHVNNAGVFPSRANRLYGRDDRCSLVKAFTV